MDIDPLEAARLEIPLMQRRLAAIGLVVAEARWALYFLPLENYLAGVFLLLVFYVASGLVQHHLNDDLERPVVGEFALITAIGIAIVAMGRVFEAGV